MILLLSAYKISQMKIKRRIIPVNPTFSGATRNVKQKSVYRTGALFPSTVICRPNIFRFSLYSRRYAVAFFLAARLAIIFCRFISRHV